MKINCCRSVTKRELCKYESHLTNRSKEDRSLVGRKKKIGGAKREWKTTKGSNVFTLKTFATTGKR